MLESCATGLHYGWKTPDLQPRVVVSVRLKLNKILDFVVHTALADELDLADVLEENWRLVNNGGDESLGQALGRAAHDLGIEGFIVPSAKIDDGVNIAVLPEALGPHSHMEVVGEKELDRWIKKR